MPGLGEFVVGARRWICRLSRLGEFAVPLQIVWIFVVVFPIRRIGFDIFPFGFHIALIANNVFIIIFLPNGRCIARAGIVDAQSDSGFIGTNNGGDGTGNGFAELFNRRGTAGVL